MSDFARDLAYCYGHKFVKDCKDCERRKNHPKTGEHWWMVAPKLKEDDLCKYKKKEKVLAE